MRKMKTLDSLKTFAQEHLVDQLELALSRSELSDQDLIEFDNWYQNNPIQHEIQKQNTSVGLRSFKLMINQ